MRISPVYTIPFSFHIGLGKAIRYENFSCSHDANLISDWFHTAFRAFSFENTKTV